jgi:hypothetical protein
MSVKRKSWMWSTVVLALVLIGGCQKQQETDAAAGKQEQEEPAISGPFVHENLAVFLIHSDQQDDRDFITLDQGLKDDVVKISEKKQAQVQELEIDNQSEQYLFLQEGDRVRGGQQDRIITTSLVIPPQSGKMPLPSFCVEQSRWHGQARFGATSNEALAPKEVRQASKVSNEQQKVWSSVRGIKNQACADEKVKAPNTNSSLNETLDSPQVKKISDECANSLKSVLDDHPTAVGVAIVVNGKIEEINVYPSRQLLGKLYPRLLQSYALQAALDQNKAKGTKPVTVADVRTFLNEREEKAKATSREVNGDNKLRLCDGTGKTECETLYEGKVVHRQWLNKEGMTTQAAEETPQSDLQRAEPAPNQQPRQQPPYQRP